MHFSTIFILFGAIAVPSIDARKLTWLLSTSYNITKNWNKGRLPCSTDTVVFPMDMAVAVELPSGQLKMKEIILPKNGEIVFPRQGSISIFSQNRIDGSCEGGDNVWIKDVPGKWLSPDNWSGPSSACPDLEAVPCPTDEVVFPSGSTYAVQLPPFEVSISSVTIKGTKLVGGDWDDYLYSHEGERQFFNGVLRSTGDKCEDPAGCECNAELLDRWICPNKACPIPECLEPIHPLGDCCLKCGAYLLYKFSPAVSISRIRTMLERELSSADVIWHVGRTMGYIQVVLVEKEYSGVTEDLAKKLDHRLLSGGLGLKKAKLASSGPAAYPGSRGRSVLMFFLCMLLSVTFFTIFFIYFQKGRLSINDIFSGNGGRRIAFARFENRSGAVQLGSTVSSQEVRRENIDRGFSNPMFRQEEVEPNVEGNIISQTCGNTEDSHSSSEDTSLSSETEIILGVPDQRNMEEITTQLID